MKLNKVKTKMIGNIYANTRREPRGGGVTWYFSWYGDVPSLGVLFQTVTELWVSFSQVLNISRNYGCPFRGIFHNFQKYGPYFHSIYEIMSLKSTRIYGIMRTNFSGKLARPRQMIGSDTPRPREKRSYTSREL